MIDKNHIDPNALTYYRMLKEAGFSAYFVGGAVRDLLLGKHPKDFDIATNATPHQIKRVIPYGRIIGRRFRHVMLERDGGRYEIVTFRGPIVQAQDFSESDDNSESNEGSEEVNETEDSDKRKQHPDLNQFGTAEQDAIRRDFTINALFYDPDADELVDYVEGKQDIDNRILRTIGEASARMEEDPIRILRAMRHKSKLNLQYEASLMDAMKERAALLEETSKDRIREEFLKVCNDRSLAYFLEEAKKLEILHYFAPWYKDTNEEDWQQFMVIWKYFAASEFYESSGPELGVALMMCPLVKPMVLEPYKEGIEPDAKNYLPDMKYFLGCEPLRNFFLRNLRISRIQTDYVVRGLFYWSRMTGLWLENGPPRKIIGKLHHHTPALLAAKMAVFTLKAHNPEAEIPEWMSHLADYEERKRQRQQPHRQERQPREYNQEEDTQETSEGNENEQSQDNRRRDSRDNRDNRDHRDNRENRRDNRRDHRRDYNERSSRAPVVLPPPEKPLIWNGPLHAPVLRPIFNEEHSQRWMRKNQTVRAYRPSGIPNPPMDLAFLKSNVVANYKPEILESVAEESQERESHHHRRQHRNQRRHSRSDRYEQNDNPEQEDRNGDQSENAEHQGQDDDQKSTMHSERNDNYESDSGNENIPVDEAPGLDEDGIGNRLVDHDDRYNARGDSDEEEDIDDNIGNRLDAPPTSGHVGVNGDGNLGSRDRGHRNDRQGGGGGFRGGRNRHHRGNNRRRRGGGGHRSGGGGGGARFRGGASHNSG